MLSLTAGHERKHNACRAEVGGCISGYTYISRVKSPQNVCRGSFEECNLNACCTNDVQLVELLIPFCEVATLLVLNSMIIVNIMA